MALDVLQRLAEQAGTIITMVPSSEHVEQVYLGPNGVLQGLQRLLSRTTQPADSEQGQDTRVVDADADAGAAGADSTATLCLDSSTISPTVSRRLAATIRSAHPAQRWCLLDAPVSGGVTGATNATLTFMLGASTAEEHAQAETVLQGMGRRVIWCGGPGAGLSGKIANNLLLGVSMAGTCEAMQLGMALGLHPRVLAGLINQSTGQCWASQVNNPAPGSLETPSPADRGYEGGFASRLLLKDLGLALEAAGDVQEHRARSDSDRNSSAAREVHLPMARAVHRMYARLVDMAEGGYANKDFGVLFQALASPEARRLLPGGEEGGGKKKQAGEPRQPPSPT